MDASEGFDVFLSYSRAEAALAERLSRRIRRYRAPRALRMERRRLRVFRDVERLTPRGELSDALRAQVHAARNLVVVCSPAAAASKYVNDEVAAFVERNGSDGLRVVLAEGSVPDSLPAALRSVVSEPLYVDLRPAGGWWRRRRRFLQESLRVIAAALGVDYGALAREDERRSRRQRALAAAASLAGAVLIGAAWLVTGVPADAWVRVAVPQEHRGQKVRPFAGWAVYRKDPDVRVFNAVGAEYVAQRPRSILGVVPQTPPRESLEELRETVLRYLDALPQSSSGTHVPVGSFQFSIVEDPAAAGGLVQPAPARPMGSGELVLEAVHRRRPSGPEIVNYSNAPSLSWCLRYEGRTSEGEEVRLTLPRMPIGGDPFDLSHWPTTLMLEQQALPLWGYIRGEFHLAWEPEPQPLVYKITNQAETFDAGADKFMREAVFTDGDPSRTVEVAGRRLALADFEGNTFRDLENDPGWSSYRPLRPHVEENVSALTTDEDGDLQFVAGGRQARLDDSVMPLLERTLSFGAQERYLVHHLRREETQPPLDVVTVLTYESEAGALVPRFDIPRVFLKAGDGEWKRLIGLDLSPEAIVVDILVFGADPAHLLLVSNRDGYRITRDGGDTWSSFNHGESMFTSANMTFHSRLETVIAGEPPVLHAVVDDRGLGDDLQEERPRPLFRYVHRGWTERLRVGWAELTGTH